MHFKDVKSIISSKNGMNIYRGCTHGCIYCDSRSKCYNFDHDFEDIQVKNNSTILIERTLRSKRKKCMISTGAMSDPYVNIEAKLENTRDALKVIDKYGFGINILTKSDLILRDLDLLKSINKKSKCVVQMSLSTYDEDLCKIIEPNVATTKRRVEVLKVMRDNNIPTIVWLMPFLPYINDTEENIKGLLDYCVEAEVYGVLNFGFGLTLRDGNREYLYEKFDESFPNMKNFYEKKYGGSYIISSDNKKELNRVFKDTCTANNIVCDSKKIFEYLNKFEDNLDSKQISLF